MYVQNTDRIQQVVTLIDTILGNNASEPEIVALLQVICQFVPSPNGESTVDCSKVPSLPNFAVQIPTTAGLKTFTLTPKDYILEVCWLLMITGAS
jgi:phytepsin